MCRKGNLPVPQKQPFAQEAGYRQQSPLWKNDFTTQLYCERYLRINE